MKGICLFFCLIWCCSVFSQHILSGKIAYQQLPLEGATVRLQGEKNALQIAGSNGYFKFEQLPSGVYTITVSFSGFAVFMDTVTVPHDLPLAIQMQPLPLLLQSVEVKATRASALAPFAKTELDATFIQKNNWGQDIPMLLNQTANVVVNSDAGNGIGYTGIRIRGTDATRINMTINGIPYNDPESQGTFFVNLPDFLSGVSSVQVQRGVGASSNGVGAFGATMNFSTHAYQPNAFVSFNNSFGSFNTLKNTLKVGSGLLGKRFIVEARLSSIVSDGYVDRASSKLNGAMLSAAWYGNKSSLRFNLMAGKEKTYQAWNGIPSYLLTTNRKYNSAGTEQPERPYVNETDNYRQNHIQLFYNATINRQLTFTSTTFLTTGQGYYEQYKAQQVLADYGLPAGTTSDLIRQLWLKNKLWGQLFSLQLTTKKHELTWGGGVTYYPGQHYGDVTWSEKYNLTSKFRWYTLNAFKSDINNYLKWSYHLTSQWHLFADVQHRYVQYRINGFRNNPQLRLNNQWHFFNPKAGITYKKENTKLYASFAIANKEPNRDDFEAGIQQKPKSEQLQDVEIGFEQKNVLQGWHLSVNGYAMNYKDQLVLTGKINDVGAYTRSNLPRSYRIGVELESVVQKKHWNFKYLLAISSNKVKNFTAYYDDYDNGGQIGAFLGNTPIAFSPAIIQQAIVDWKPLPNFECSLFSKYTGSQFLDNSGKANRKLDPFWVNDCRVSYHFEGKKLQRRVDVIFQLNNFLNSQYEPNGYTFSYFAGGMLSTENYFYPMAGTNWLVGVNISLEKR